MGPGPSPVVTTTPTPGPTPSVAPPPSPTPVPGPPAQGILTGANAGKSTRDAAVGTVFECIGQEILASNQPWTDNETGVVDLDASPRVPGAVLWDRELQIIVDGDDRLVQSNSLPEHPTGIFPVPVDSEAYEFDRNPNSIAAQAIDWVLPTEPEAVDVASCVGFGPIAIMLTGAPLYNAMDANGYVAVAEHTVDDCLGHPAGRTGQYHYHSDSPCFDQGADDEHSPLLGYVVDGFGLYGPRDEAGEYIGNADLDECHGHTGPAPDEAGDIQNAYHYHVNNEFPFTVGCYRGSEVTVAGPAHEPHAHPHP